MWNWIVGVCLCITLYYAFTRTRPPPKRSRPSANYNGPFYERFIDPLIGGLHVYISKQVPSKSTVIDACCGTGQLAFKLAVQCDKVIGIDISPKMIEVANKKKNKLGMTNVEFLKGDVIELLSKKLCSQII